MVHFSAAFGARALEMLKETGQTPSSVELRSERRVSHMTVRRMTRGYTCSSDKIIEFADTVGRTPSERADWANELLDLVESRAAYKQQLVSVIYGVAGRGEARLAAVG